MKKTKLIVMIGVSGCGKSYLAKRIQETHDDCIIVSRDAIRFALLKDGEDYFAHEKEVVKRYYDNINRAIGVHKYVIADATHLTVSARRKFFNNVRTKDAYTIGIWIDTPLEVALKQNAQRSGRARVDEQVIKDMYKRRVSPRTSEDFDEMMFISMDVDMAISSHSVKIGSIFDKLKEI